jgi:hypothetical protein
MNTTEVIKKLSDFCRLKHLSYATEKSYSGWVQSYIRALGKMPAEWPSERRGLIIDITEPPATQLAPSTSTSTDNPAGIARLFVTRHGTDAC